jgi:hypothetical protein
LPSPPTSIVEVQALRALWVGSGGLSHSLLSLPRRGGVGQRLPSSLTSVVEIPLWVEDGGAACLLFRVTESTPVRIAPPSIFPAVVSEVVVVIVLEGDATA